MSEILLNHNDLTVTVGAKTARLTRKAADVLIALGEAKGQPLDRESLMKLVWRDSVVDDASLKQHIYTLRGVLRELDPDHEYIETVPRRGYRLAAQIVVEDTVDAGVPKNGSGHLVPPVAPGRRTPFRRSWMAVAGVALAMSLVWSGWLGWKKWRAKQLVAQGFHELRNRRGGDLTPISSLFNSALSMDPGNAVAYAGLAQTMARHAQRYQRHALEMANRSLSLDAGCGPCLSTRGWILFTREWNWAGAKTDLERGAVLQPDFVEGHLWLAQFLASTGRLAEAKQEIGRAVELAPSYAAPYAMRSGIYYLAGDYQLAIDEAARARALQSRFTAAFDWTFRASLQLGRNEDALYNWIATEATFMDLSTEAQIKESERVLGVYKQHGLTAAVDLLLERMSQPPAIETQRYQRAVWRMWKGDRTGALDELEAAAIAKPFHLIYIAVDPVFQPIRGDARFKAVVTKLGIAPLLASR